jgi:flagellar motor switch protein FliM
VYDFKRPERVSKEQMRAFHALHEGFSREFGAGLSAMLRTICEVKLISVDQLTYSEFVFSLESPTCFNLIESKGLEGHIILDLNPSIVFPIVDRLLGGGKETRQQQTAPQRPLTEIELRIASRVTSLALQALENAWSNICKLELRVAQIESNPQLVQIVPPNEVVVLVSFEITMAERRGILNLCVPFNTIESQANKLTSDSWLAYKRKSQDSTQKLKVETGLSRATVELVVRMATTNLTTADVMSLEKGDVIMTDQKASIGAEVLIEGRPVFRASPGVFKGKKAIRVGAQIKSPKTLVEEQLAKDK